MLILPNSDEQLVDDTVNELFVSAAQDDSLHPMRFPLADVFGQNNKQHRVTPEQVTAPLPFHTPSLARESS